MTIWNTEIKELNGLYSSIKGRHPKLDTELEKLIKADDENMVLVYARRCLEIIISDLCERELNRPRGSQPLKGLIDKLNKEEKVPHHIIVSMQNINSLSTFGAHPKEFDTRQVKPFLLNLSTTLEWYYKYLETQVEDESNTDVYQKKSIQPKVFKGKATKMRKRRLLISKFLLALLFVTIVLLAMDLFWDTKQTKEGAIESVLILPFGNYTGDNQLEYFVSGMHSSLIGDMGQVSGLRVISETSSKAYKNVEMSIKDIAKELNVEAVIETSVMCLGDSICVQFKLVGVYPEEKQLWVGNFKEEKSQILNLYNRVTRQIADEVMIKLTPNEKDRLSESITVDTAAYNAYLKGKFYLNKINKNALDSAKKYFKRAIEINPDWSPPHGGLAGVFAYKMQMRILSPSIAIPKAFTSLNTAHQLDPNSANSHYLKATFAVWTEWDWQKGEKEFKKSLELNPNNGLCRMFYAHLLMILRRYDKAVVQANHALKLDPKNPFALGLYSVVMVGSGNISAGIKFAEMGLEIDSSHYFTNTVLASAYYYSANYNKWFKIWKKHIAMLNDEEIVSLEKIFHEQGHIAVIEEFVKIKEEHGKNGGQINPMQLAYNYVKLKKYDKAVEYYQKAYEIHDPNMPYLTEPFYNVQGLKKHPGFIEILKKMNLPIK